MKDYGALDQVREGTGREGRCRESRLQRKPVQGKPRVAARTGESQNGCVAEWMRRGMMMQCGAAARRPWAVKDTLVFDKKLRPSVVTHTCCAGVHPVSLREGGFARGSQASFSPFQQQVGCSPSRAPSHFPATSRSLTSSASAERDVPSPCGVRAAGERRSVGAAEIGSGVGRPILKFARFLAGPSFSGMSILRKMLGTLDLLTALREAARARRRRCGAQRDPASGVTRSCGGAVVEEALHGRSRRH